MDPSNEYMPRRSNNNSWCCFFDIFLIRMFQNGIVSQNPMKQLVKLTLNPHTGIRSFTILGIEKVSYPVVKKMQKIIIL